MFILMEAKDYLKEQEFIILGQLLPYQYHRLNVARAAWIDVLG